MASFNRKNIADIICNHKKMWGKEIKYAIDFASTQLRIIRLHKNKIDPKLIWSSVIISISLWNDLIY